MITKFERRKKRIYAATNFLGIIIFIFILVATIYLIISNIKINQKRNKLNAQIEAIKTEIEDFENKNESLKEGISRVGEEAYIEKVAREELSLQKEGEKVVGFILPAEGQKESEEKNYWQPKNWWVFLKDGFGWLKSKF
ncbi:septum formation initiator family protein [Patescibacteria group bacterium]|nr:septum formation initiator family protein [Patescibacteria group bacterium]